MRDLRHVPKMFYLLGHERFYVPYENSYQPTAEYHEIIRDMLGARKWETGVNGVWFHVRPVDPVLPDHGWKIHISATTANAESILRSAVPILIEFDVAFKCAVDRNTLSLMGSKGWHRGGSGKFMTIYPISEESFRNIIARLYEALRDERGPYILSDRRYRDSGVLYYRYGGIRATRRTEIIGTHTMVIASPSGDLVPDIRNPYYSPPSWVSEPFPEEDDLLSESVELKNGRYLVQEALSFSNTGGVYSALDRVTGAKVVIKEARACTAVDSFGVDAVGRLKKEFAILQELEGTSITAKALDSFDEWEHSFIVEEFIEGSDIREIMLSRSPLLKVAPTADDSEKFYELFSKLFRSFIGAVETAHSRGIVLGDVSAGNLKVDPVTFDVRLIDFEGACRAGIDEPGLLFTPGFRNPISGRLAPSTFADDYYGVAAVMLYTMFPIAAMASIQPALFDLVLRAIVTDVGWSDGNVVRVITGLARSQITGPEAGELLQQVPASFTPMFVDDVDRHWAHDTVQRMGQFLLAHMVEGRYVLFPTDPFAYQTNTLSLGFGACGTLFALAKCGFDIPESAFAWLNEHLDSQNLSEIPPGLLTGSSGVAWCLRELGQHDRARSLMTHANESAMLLENHSMFYGSAGVGMANLSFYVSTGEQSYLQQAEMIGDALLKTARQHDQGIYWSYGDKTWIGYGYGQSGVALFLLRLHEATGRQDVLKAGIAALQFDLASAVSPEAGVKSFYASVDGNTYEPYLEEGSAGVAKVALRYGMLEEVRPVLRDIWRKYAVFPGLLFGLGSFVDVLTDAYIESNDSTFLEMARRPLAGIRDMYTIDTPDGIAVPGDNLFRVSCDYGTGVAGTMRAIYRFANRAPSDFTLDGAFTQQGLVRAEAVAVVP